MAEQAIIKPAEVWDKYRSTERANQTRVREHRDKTLIFGAKILKYYVNVKGEKPDDGYSLYIALHGGGGEPVELNNGAWERMQTQYIQSIQHGVYVVPRGITDTWDMHFRPESFLFYDRLIENMILFEDVNPDKVYLLGYSAGGDGVYQIAPRMADRFAAVNMSAGHHNSVNLQNLSNLPIALQAGENDTDYSRNVETAKANTALDTLARNHPGFYIHTTWIHAGKGHRFNDNDPKKTPQPVFHDPDKWVTGRNGQISFVNTNAICWLDQFERNSRPQWVIWDVKTRADRHGEKFWNTNKHGEQHYWVDIGDNTAETLGVDTIIVGLEKENNRIRVEKCGKYLRLLVDGHMLDLDQHVEISVDGTVKTVLVRPSREIQLETIEQRGDPRYIFEGSITVIKMENGWDVTSP